MCRPPRRWRSVAADRSGGDGGSVVEAVLVIPAVMLVLLVVVQFALWAHASQVTQLAAAEGNRTARALGNSAASGSAQAQTVLESSRASITGTTVSIDILPGGIVRTRVTGYAVSIVPELSFPVSATVVGPQQEFRPGA